jgi:hypothetical protein
MDRTEFLRRQAERFSVLAEECADPNISAKLQAIATRGLGLVPTPADRWLADAGSARCGRMTCGRTTEPGERISAVRLCRRVVCHWPLLMSQRC